MEQLARKFAFRDQLTALTPSRSNRMAYGHGKVILFGEHSVVHGRPAWPWRSNAARRCRRERQQQAGRPSLRIAPWDVEVDTGAELNEGREPLQKALKVARAFYGDERELALSATMRLPSGAGMGSSAALGVAVLRAMDERADITRPSRRSYERSLAWERVFHGNPSGVDNAMATTADMAIFKKGPEPLTAHRATPRHKVRLVAATAAVLQHQGDGRVAWRASSSGARGDRKSSSTPSRPSSATAKLALEQGDMKGLGQLMTMNQMLLRLRSCSPPRDRSDDRRRHGGGRARCEGHGRRRWRLHDRADRRRRAHARSNRP